MSDLVHKGANEVDETTLQLWQFFCFVSVHHGLKEREVFKACTYSELVLKLTAKHFNGLMYAIAAIHCNPNL